MVETESSSRNKDIEVSEVGGNTNPELYQPSVQQQPDFTLSPAQLNAKQPIYYSTANRCKVYQIVISQPSDPLYDGNTNNVNLFYHALKDRSESQGCNLVNGDIVSIPGCKNKNVTKYMIVNNLQIQREGI